MKTELNLINCRIQPIQKKQYEPCNHIITRNAEHNQRDNALQLAV